MNKQDVLSLPFADFFGYLAAIRKKEEEEFNKQLKLSAFTGWQVYLLLSSGGGSNNKPVPFIEYSDNLGILSDHEKEYLQLYKKMEQQIEQANAKKYIEKAANIVEMDRKNRERKAGKQTGGGI